jgi:hypothetical protein
MLLAAVLLVAAPAAWALDADDVARLAGAKVGDEVILAQIRAERARFVLTADQIIRLRKEGVSDAVLRAMIETGKPRPAAEAPAGAPARTEPPPAPAAEPGTLVLENLDSRDYSVQVDAEGRNVFFYWGSSAAGREPLPARASQVYRLPPGGYRLTWVGGAESLTITVFPGRGSRATLTRAVAGGAQTIQVALSEDGVSRGGGSLLSLSAPATPAPVAAEPASTATGRQIVVVREAPAPPAYYRETYYGPPAAAVAVGALALTCDLLLLGGLHHHDHRYWRHR